MKDVKRMTAAEIAAELRGLPSLVREAPSHRRKSLLHAKQALRARCERGASAIDGCVIIRLTPKRCHHE